MLKESIKSVFKPAETQSVLTSVISQNREKLLFASLCLSVCPHRKNLGSHRTDFHEI